NDSPQRPQITDIGIVAGAWVVSPGGGGGGAALGPMRWPPPTRRQSPRTATNKRMNRRPRRTANRGTPPMSVDHRAFVVPMCRVCPIAVPVLDSVAITTSSPVPTPWGMGRCGCEVFVPALAVTRNRYVRLAGAGVRKEKVVLFVLPLRTIVRLLSATW